MAALTDDQGQLFKRKNLGIVATRRRNGAAQLTPVWVDWDGEDVLFNTAEGRVKPRNIRRDPVVSIHVTEHDDPYRWITVTGPAEIIEDGAREHINELSHRYVGRDFQFGADEKRLIVRIKPERVVARGF
jgi:PPOX class probable F420-dependent enzyme